MERSSVAVNPARLFKPVNIAVLTVSDTRTLETDTSGGLLVERLEAARHHLADRAIVRDEVPLIAAQLDSWIADAGVDCVISTGGTGVTGRDITPEAVEQVRAAHGGKDVPGFGELFRWLSFKSIGTSTMQSRACAVVADGTWIFALPGSNGAVKDGWDQILAEQLDSRNGPCNIVELMPRLRER